MTWRQDLEDTWNWVRQFGRTRSSQRSIQESVPALLASPSASPLLSLPSPSLLKLAPERAPSVAPRGWRAWRAEPSDDGYVLWSPSQRYEWRGPTVKDAEAPGGDMQTKYYALYGGTPNNGFHIARDRARAEEYLGSLQAQVWHSDAFEPRLLTYQFGVLGEVEGHGGVIEHELGWRVQACTVRRLIVFVDDKTLRADLERRYDCDVEVEKREVDLHAVATRWIAQALQSAPWQTFWSFGTQAFASSLSQPIYPGKIWPI